MKKLLFGFFGLALLLTVGCNEDTEPEPALYGVDALLKQTTIYSSANDTEPISIMGQYEYDDQNRISKISRPNYIDGKITSIYEYDLYEYNDESQLISISNFSNNLYRGFIIMKKSTYTYSPEGLKIKEYIEFPESQNSSSYTLYSYQGDQVIKTENFDQNDQLELYYTHEYKNGQLVKMIKYAPDGEMLSFQNYIYSDGLNIRKEAFTGGEVPEKAFEDVLTYDSNRNLVMMERKILAPWMSSISRVIRYEYY